MKKAFILLTTLCSGSLFAAGNATQADTTNPPMLKLAVYDVSGKEPKDVGLKYSRKNNNLQLCWTAFNMPFAADNNNNVFQQFTAPAKVNYQGVSNVVMSNNNKTATIHHVLPAHEQKFITQCWKYEPKDPLGKYQLIVRVNDIQFEPLEFEVVK